MRALLVWTALGACGLAGEAPAPRLVTSQTRADPAALAKLERPGKVVFEDDFESPDSQQKYFEIRGGKEGLAKWERDPAKSRFGIGALRLTAPGKKGQESGVGATAWLGDEGFDQLHLRYYLRYATDYDQGHLNHTGGSLSGVAGKGRWDGMGTAGLRPRGDDRFNSRLEAWRDWGRLRPPGYLYLYTYWMDMKQDQDGHYWGNFLEPEEKDRVIPVRGRWYCLEHMIRVNTPGKFDGELAAWVDGKLYIHYTGIRWRSDASLRIKRLDLGLYIHQAAKDNTVWFDEVVAATGYIGPREQGTSSTGD